MRRRQAQRRSRRLPGEWLREIEATGTVRLSHPVLLRFGLWEGARTGRPLQIHTGFGDTDLDLYRADPALMTDFLRATETVCPVMLLHTYPFQRSAGYLAQMFGHVYVDVGPGRQSHGSGQRPRHRRVPGAGAVPEGALLV